MTHNIQALISRRSTFVASVRSHPFNLTVELPQSFAMTLCTSEFLEWVTAPGCGGDLPEPNVFECLTPAVVGYAKELSSHGPVAYVETNYWGGLGGQAAIVYLKGTITLPACSQFSDEPPSRNELRSYPINRALTCLGVEETSAIDHFDSLGLGTFRRNRDWLMPPKYLKRH
jgi:hypothetical protein